MIKKEEIIQLFGLKDKPTPKGWYEGKCPTCGSDKFAVCFEKEYNGKILSSFNCFSGKCGKKGSLFTLLKEHKRLDLIEYTFNAEESLSSKLEMNKEETELDISPIKVSRPLGWRRVYSNEYLESRGWTKEDFEKYKVGTTTLFSMLKDYVVIMLEEDETCVGWLARSTKSKEEIEQIEKETGRSYPKYINTPGVDFEKIVGGINDIKEEYTHTVIITEGFLSKKAVDDKLDLKNKNVIKCICTFGSKISQYQLKKLKGKGIKNVILCFDPDAIDKIKKIGEELERQFSNVLIIPLFKGDPDEITEGELKQALIDSVTVSEFKTNTVLRKKLK